jgi:hypothetical protein
MILVPTPNLATLDWCFVLSQLGSMLPCFVVDFVSHRLGVSKLNIAPLFCCWCCKSPPGRVEAKHCSYTCTEPLVLGLLNLEWWPCPPYAVTHSCFIACFVFLLPTMVVSWYLNG